MLCRCNLANRKHPRNYSSAKSQSNHSNQLHPFDFSPAKFGTPRSDDDRRDDLRHRPRMSTGPRTQDAFIRGNQSTAEQDASHSALLYLFQEVSKLASPVHGSFLDTKSPTKWLDETSRLDNFIVNNEEADAHSFQTSNNSCQHSLSCMSAFNQVKKVKEERNSSKVTAMIEPRCECSSPWKVLSLINLHCERLLHRREDSDLSSVSSFTTLGSFLSKSLAVAEGVTEQENKSDSVSSDAALRPPLIYDRQDTTASDVADVKGDCTKGTRNYKPHYKDPNVAFSVEQETMEKTDTVTPELVEEKAAASSQLHCGARKEAETSVNRRPVALSQMHTSNASQNIQLSFNPDKDASVAPSKSAVTLDYNANIALIIEPPFETQLPSSSTLPTSGSTSLLNITGKCHSDPKVNRTTGCKPELTHALTEENSPPDAQVTFCNVTSAATETKSKPEQQEEFFSLSAQRWRAKTPRKQPHPSRSIDIQDPDFQGVTFRIDTELDDSREQCRLLITSKYSKELCKSVRKPKLRTRTSQKSLKSSSSDEENELTTNTSKGKVCASCCTRKTPMWRDAEDGTPLCNACGIRYKKYRVRCVNCWHIPRKEGASNSRCLKCGKFVRLASAQRKHTT